jgi:hypothetical protein
MMERGEQFANSAQIAAKRRSNLEQLPEIWQTSYSDASVLMTG